jgi:Putative peptidoglycan binding domain
MKKITSLLIVCSLALAGAAIAQPPEQQSTPTKKKPAAEKTHAAEAQPGIKAPKPHEPAVKEPGAGKHERAASKGRDVEAAPKSEAATGTKPDVSGEPGPTHERGAKGHKAQPKSEPGAQTGTDVSGQPAGVPGAKHHAEQRKKGIKEPGAAKTAATPAAPAASVAPAAAGQQNAQANVAGGKKAKPDPQKVQQIKAQHANFRAQPKPDKVPAVTYNQNYRIQGSDQWQGSQYEVFRSYRPEWHDQGWYHSHYPTVSLIGGGYYFFNSGYWYPAWGYSTSAQYYAYDGPIYVGQRAEPPDKVIADVQAVLQEMGYYTGEVDGLLGPLTREALTAYQADQGLATTAAIDQPTLDSLGMG